MISESGSTDPTDHDGAVKNQVDGVVDWWSGIWDSDNAFIRTIKIILGLVVFVIIFKLVFNLIVAIVNGIRKMKK